MNRLGTCCPEQLLVEPGTQALKTARALDLGTAGALGLGTAEALELGTTDDLELGTGVEDGTHLEAGDDDGETSPEVVKTLWRLARKVNPL